MYLGFAARALGFEPIFLLERPDEPAGLAGFQICLRASDESGFASRVDVITIESEFHGIPWLEAMDNVKPVRPSPNSLRLIQNKLEQKRFLTKSGFPTLEFRAVSTLEEVEQALLAWGTGVFKAGMGGYDGKGTLFLDGPVKPDDADTIQNFLEKGAGYVERKARFTKEIAVLVARSVTGETAVYPPIETCQAFGMCQWARYPAELAHETDSQVQSIGSKLVEALGHIGVLAIEMFQLEDGSVVINELAPRVHNSGHLTLDGFATSQFEQHVRAVMGLQLGSVAATSQVSAMANVIGGISRAGDGEFVVSGADLREPSFGQIKLGLPGTIEADSGVRLYWYGKFGTSLKRKLGHVNATGTDMKDVLENALKVRGEVSV
jgi:5-(carboxyamino)imidazole ribonucleotide synthase